MNRLKFPVTKHQLSVLALAGFAAVSGSSAIAQQALGGYVGGNVGATRADFGNNATNSSLVNPGFPIYSTNTNNKSTGYKLYGGYQFTPYFALEGGYFDLGRFGYGFNGDTRVSGLNLDLVGTVPITDRFSIFGRVGAAYARSRTNVPSTGFVPFNSSNSSQNGTNVKFGVGLEYAITDALSVRAELERYRINLPVRNRGNIDMASVGLVYRFGGKVQTPVAETYVPPPAPSPVYVAPPPPPAPPPPAYEPPVRPAKQGRN